MEALERAARAISACRSRDDLLTCYCPNCDNSISNNHVRAAILAFLDVSEGEIGDLALTIAKIDGFDSKRVGRAEYTKHALAMLAALRAIGSRLLHA